MKLRTIFWLPLVASFIFLDSSWGSTAANLEEIVSHPGERFHVHYIDKDMTVSGHVDQFSVHAGATLWLPKN